MAKRKVTYIKLHQNSYAPGVGELRNTFPSSEKTLDNLEMFADQYGNVEVSFKYKGLKKNLLFTAPNIQVMDLALE